MTLEPQLKVSVLEDNCFVFGDSEIRLLEAIARQGTLTEGAATLGISYRVAWGKLRDLEAAVGVRLVERTVGGRRGGSSRLTDSALSLVDRYRGFRERVGEFALLEFQRAFGDIADCTNLVAGGQGELAGVPDSLRGLPHSNLPETMTISKQS